MAVDTIPSMPEGCVANLVCMMTDVALRMLLHPIPVTATARLRVLQALTGHIWFFAANRSGAADSASAVTGLVQFAGAHQEPREVAGFLCTDSYELGFGCIRLSRYEQAMLVEEHHGTNAMRRIFFSVVGVLLRLPCADFLSRISVLLFAPHATCSTCTLRALRRNMLSVVPHRL